MKRYNDMSTYRQVITGVRPEGQGDRDLLGGPVATCLGGGRA